MSDIDGSYRGVLRLLGVEDTRKASVPTRPDALIRSLLDYALERSYLEQLSQVPTFAPPGPPRRGLGWVQITRLPVHPTTAQEYDLLSRWQGVLSSLHAWHYGLVFLLMRHSGRTHLFLGVTSQSGLELRENAAAQLCQSAMSHMPGIEIQPIRREQEGLAILAPLSDLGAAGAVTGLPSRREGTGFGLLQTLDQVAFGIRDFSPYEHDYALVVVADPVPDGEVANTIRVLRMLGSEIHGYVKATENSAENKTVAMSQGLNWGLLAGFLASAVPGIPQLLPGALMHLGIATNQTVSAGQVRGITMEHLDKTAQYFEQVTDKHVERLQLGRSLGFWNTGVYVLGGTESTVNTLTGMLRSVYSGEASHLEPIRTHLFQPQSRAVEYIRRYQPLPLPGDDQREAVTREWTGRASGWHPLGAMYEGVTTPLNSEELALTTSLPRQDVPGLRFRRHSVRFVTNPPTADDSGDYIPLGKMLDNGVTLDADYIFDLNSLVRHAMVTGMPGFGKSTTCRRLFLEVVARDVPVLVIEPAKEDYVRWAIQHNQNRPAAEQIGIYMPGVSEMDGFPFRSLRLNLFEPATAGDTVDFAARYERLAAILAASLPMADVLPLLLEEAVYCYMQNTIGVHFEDGEQPVREDYPRLKGLLATAKRIVETRGYEARIQDNLKAAIETRVGALMRGKRGQILDVTKSTSWDELFNRCAVVNLSQITDNRDKALIMALLLTALSEYRISRYRRDATYRERAHANKLCHLTIVEEAHRLLKNPTKDFMGVGNPQAVVAEMFVELLAEIRQYGQGLLIVDQVPGDLIPNAIKNTNCKIVHRLGTREDRGAMSACMGLRLDQEEVIATLDVGQAVVSTHNDDAASWVKIYEPK